MPDDTQADFSQTVAALRRELDTKTAERDEALRLGRWHTGLGV